MRHILFILSTLISTSTLFAQQDSVVYNIYSGEPEITAFQSVLLKTGFHVPSGNNLVVKTIQANAENRNFVTGPSRDRTFVLTRTFKTSGIKSGDLHLQRNLASESQQIQYYDDWGRLTQTNTIMVSPKYRDVVTPVRYDAHGRNATKYLPFASSTAADGSFKSNDVSSQGAFYGGSGLDPLSPKTSAPYAVSVYNEAPDNKITRQGAVGVTWQPHLRPVKYDEVFNNNLDFSNPASRKVRRFTVNTQDTSSTNTPIVNGYYADNELKVYIITNEGWTSASGRTKTVEKYVDKKGNTVLKRRFTILDNGNFAMLSTYYIYSDLGELYFVLTPGMNPDAAAITSQSIDTYGYRYSYDKRRRMVQEKEPGKAPSYFIYNANDQLVASQDPNQRSKNEWSFTKYDLQGRIIINGAFTSTKNYYALRSEAQSSTTTHENIGTTAHGYTNVAWPTIGITRYNTIKYYDSYDVQGFPGTLAYVQLAGVSQQQYPTGSGTITKTWPISNSSQILWAVQYYDNYGRVIQHRSTNHLNGTDQVDNTYDFRGKLISSLRKHSNGSTQNMEVRSSFTYDHADRLLSVSKKVGNQTEVTLASYSYNELGQVVDKKLHQLSGQSKFLQSVDYRYNERGWLTSINDADLAVTTITNDGDADSSPDLFGARFSYNSNASVPRFDGNISAMQWKTSKVSSQSTAPPKMGYQYLYDDLGRMKFAFSETNGSEDNRHDEYVRYDINGNITSLIRYASIANTRRQIDSLIYSYDGYRSRKIDDISLSVSKNLGFEDKSRETIEYEYDANGNMTKDKNKDISISYNEFNLPSQILFGTNHRLEFLYDRNGKKLQAKYTNQQSTYTIDYIDDIQYQQGLLAFMHTEEGRIRKNGSLYHFEYDLKDHLGNVRVTFMPETGTPSQTVVKVLQQNSYYPYGMTMQGDGTNGLHLSYVDGEKSKFLYSGKELYDQGGLNWYDHGSRMYDPSTGRWSVADPAGQFTNPYLAMGNNPVIYMDPNGEWINLVIGAAIGGVTNWAFNGAKFNGEGLKYFGVGALAGAIGAGVGSGVSSALANASFSAGFIGSAAAGSVGTGFMSSAVIGASAGAAGGFTSGFGNSLVAGNGFGTALKDGGIAGGMGLLTGGIVGGVSGGLNATSQGRDFWTGKGTVTEYLMATDQHNTGERYGSYQDMEADYNTVIGNKDGVSLQEAQDRLNTSVQLANREMQTTDGYINTGQNGRGAEGMAIYNSSGGFRNKVSSTIYMAPAVKGLSPIYKNHVFKHEFIHAYHMMKHLPNLTQYSERAASRFSDIYFRYHNLPLTDYITNNLGNYPSVFYYGFVKNIIPLWLP